MARALGTAAQFGGILLGVGYVGIGMSVRQEQSMRLIKPGTWEELPIAGRVAVVTGGTSGIGKAVASGLASRGATVVVGRRPSSASSTSATSSASDEELIGLGRILYVDLDLASPSSVVAFAERVKRKDFVSDAGGLTVLVNCAATLEYDHRRTTEGGGMNVNFATNVFGPALLSLLLADSLASGAAAFLPTAAGEGTGGGGGGGGGGGLGRMLADHRPGEPQPRRRGRIVNVGSKMERSGMVDAAYLASQVGGRYGTAQAAQQEAARQQKAAEREASETSEQRKPGLRDQQMSPGQDAATNGAGGVADGTGDFTGSFDVTADDARPGLGDGDGGGRADEKRDNEKQRADAKAKAMAKVAGKLRKQRESKPDTPERAYSSSKLCNALFTFECARRLEAAAVPVDCCLVSPGLTNTGLFRNYPIWYRAATWPARAFFLRTPEEAAEGILWSALAAEAEGITGQFWADGQPYRARATTSASGALANVVTAIARDPAQMAGTSRAADERALGRSRMGDLEGLEEEDGQGLLPRWWLSSAAGAMDEE